MKSVKWSSFESPENKQVFFIAVLLVVLKRFFGKYWSLQFGEAMHGWFLKEQPAQKNCIFKTTVESNTEKIFPTG